MIVVWIVIFCLKNIQEDDPEKYNKQFSQYIAEGIGPDDLEDLYEKVHKAIRKDPRSPPKKQRDYKKMQLRPARPKKLSLEQRRQRRVARIAELRAQADAPRNNAIEEEEEEG